MKLDIKKLTRKEKRRLEHLYFLFSQINDVEERLNHDEYREFLQLKTRWMVLHQGNPKNRN